MPRNPLFSEGENGCFGAPRMMQKNFILVKLTPCIIRKKIQLLSSSDHLLFFSAYSQRRKDDIMPPYKFHGMITMNHSFDGLEAGPPAQEKRLALIEALSSLRGVTMDYGMSAIELGTGDESNNWHIHVVFKGKYNGQTTATTLHNYMKKGYKEAFPTCEAQHIDITWKHSGSGAS